VGKGINLQIEHGIVAAAALVLPWRKLSAEGSIATIDELNIVVSLNIEENEGFDGADDDDKEREKLVSNLTVCGRSCSSSHGTYIQISYNKSAPSLALALALALALTP
jgi:hypothetical protein